MKQKTTKFKIVILLLLALIIFGLASPAYGTTWGHHVIYDFDYLSVSVTEAHDSFWIDSQNYYQPIIYNASSVTSQEYRSAFNRGMLDITLSVKHYAYTIINKQTSIGGSWSFDRAGNQVNKSDVVVFKKSNNDTELVKDEDLSTNNTQKYKPYHLPYYYKLYYWLFGDHKGQWCQDGISRLTIRNTAIANYPGPISDKTFYSSDNIEYEQADNWGAWKEFGTAPYGWGYSYNAPLLGTQIKFDFTKMYGFKLGTVFNAPDKLKVTIQRIYLGDEFIDRIEMIFNGGTGIFRKYELESVIMSDVNTEDIKVDTKDYVYTDVTDAIYDRIAYTSIEQNQQNLRTSSGYDPGEDDPAYYVYIYKVDASYDDGNSWTRSWIPITLIPNEDGTESNNEDGEHCRKKIPVPGLLGTYLFFSDTQTTAID